MATDLTQVAIMAGLFGLAAFALVGYCLNGIKLIRSIGKQETLIVQFLLRSLGIFVPPIGACLGFFDDGKR